MNEAQRAQFEAVKQKLIVAHCYMHECNLGNGVVCNGDNFVQAIEAAYAAGAAAENEACAKLVEEIATIESNRTYFPKAIRARQEQNAPTPQRELKCPKCKLFHYSICADCKCCMKCCFCGNPSRRRTVHPPRVG